MKIAVYSRNKNANGVRVIVDNITSASIQNGIECRSISSIHECDEGEILIPYGLLETIELMEAGVNPSISLLVDAISLGAWNKFVCYLKTGHIFHRDFVGTILKFCKWRYLERKVVKSVKNIMVVSEEDGIYLRRMNPDLNVIICRNGFNKAIAKKHINSKVTRLGILSSWGAVDTYEENNWFISTYFKRYIKTHKDVELVLAGRGEFINKLKGFPHVRIIGEVENLSDFYKQIDVFLAVSPKGCGILNRCLDAFAYKVPVVGHKGSLTGFKYMSDSFLSFENYRQFVNAVDSLKGDEQMRLNLIDNAYKFIEENNNWSVNMNGFISILFKLLNKSVEA